MPKNSYAQLKTALSAQERVIEAYSNAPNSASYMYLIAGVHGNEPEGVYVLECLFAWAKEQNITKPLIIIPVLNPDGLFAKTRVNANGVDLNRNWPTKDWVPRFDKPQYNPGLTPLSEPENIFLNDLFKEYKPESIVSFHSWKPMLDFNPGAEHLAQFFNEYNHYPIAPNIGYPTPGSLGTYATETLECPMLTYELPELISADSMEDIWAQNARGLQSYFAQFMR